MKRGEMGRYETTRIAGESVRAFVPHPLPSDPSVVLDASLQQALESAEAALADLNHALETSDRPTISPRPPSPPRSCSLPPDRGHPPLLDGKDKTSRQKSDNMAAMSSCRNRSTTPPAEHLFQAAAPTSERSEQNE